MLPASGAETQPDGENSADIEEVPDQPGGDDAEVQSFQAEPHYEGGEPVEENIDQHRGKGVSATLETTAIDEVYPVAEDADAGDNYTIEYANYYFHV